MIQHTIKNITAIIVDVNFIQNDMFRRFNFILRIISKKMGFKK
jgi:hypothetical protein